MKTYILRQPKPVESQKPASQSRPPKPPPEPPPPSSWDAPLAAPPGSPVLFTGFDVHSRFHRRQSGTGGLRQRVRRYGIIGGTHDDVLKTPHRS